jgi:hypothetical protein
LKFREKFKLNKNTKLNIGILKNRDQDKLSFDKIGKMYGIPSSEALEQYKTLKQIDSEGDYTWLTGLSDRAQNQLKKTPYTNLATLTHDVLSEKVDLEDFSWIGHKVALEIRRWLLKNRRIKERRNTERRKRK